jgi:cytochrome c-type biogenesis protein CcmH/NrfG
MGFLDTVDSVVDEIRDKPDEWYRLGAIVEAQANADDIQGALRTYQIYNEGEGDRSMANKALAQIAAAQARSGDLLTAREIFQRAVRTRKKETMPAVQGLYKNKSRGYRRVLEM